MRSFEHDKPQILWTPQPFENVSRSSPESKWNQACKRASGHDRATFARSLSSTRAGHVKRKKEKSVCASHADKPCLWRFFLTFCRWMCADSLLCLLVCLQTCQTTALLGAVEEAGAFGSRQHETHHSELAKKGQDAHQGTKMHKPYESFKRSRGTSHVGFKRRIHFNVFTKHLSDGVLGPLKKNMSFFIRF